MDFLQNLVLRSSEALPSLRPRTPGMFENAVSTPQITEPEVPVDNAPPVDASNPEVAATERSITPPVIAPGSIMGIGPPVTAPAIAPPVPVRDSQVQMPAAPVDDSTADLETRLRKLIDSMVTRRPALEEAQLSPLTLSPEMTSNRSALVSTATEPPHVSAPASRSPLIASSIDRPVPHVAAPSGTSPTSLQKTSISVNIGRIEIQPPKTAPSPAIPRPAPAHFPSSRIMSLEDYLKFRSQGGMS